MKEEAKTMLDYNTQRPEMKLKEYGRNVQMLVKHLRTVEDKETRNKMAYTVVDLIKQLSSGPKDYTNENMQKYWDDLYIMSDLQSSDLFAQSPFPHAPCKTKILRLQKHDKPVNICLTGPKSPDHIKHRYGRNN